MRAGSAVAGSAGGNQMVRMQGIQTLQSNVNASLFQLLTTRQNVLQRTSAFSGLGRSDTFDVQQVNLLASLQLDVTGTVTVAAAKTLSTFDWPYGLIKAIRVTVNGQSQIIYASGWQLKARAMAAEPALNDRGVTRIWGGASRTGGTLSMSSESWGTSAGGVETLGPWTSAIAAGTYTYNLSIPIPIAYDKQFLNGLIYAQTNATSITVTIDWASGAELAAVYGTAEIPAITASYRCTAESYTIPFHPQNGQPVLPDLSAIHLFVANRQPGLSTGRNEVTLVGQGVGRRLVRVIGSVLNDTQAFGAGNGATMVRLPVTDTNFGTVGYKFGASDVPEEFAGGFSLAARNENDLGSDVGKAGVFVLDFASKNAYRDTIDQGTATQLRSTFELPSGLTLRTPVFEYCQELMVAAK